MLYELILFTFLFFSCGQTSVEEKNKFFAKSATSAGSQQSQSLIDPSGNTLETRFSVPAGYERVKADSTSFGHYLRKLPLKADGVRLKYYNGSEKEAVGVYAAVVDLPIGNKDLHQCADAVMRLRAEYLYSQKLYDKIHFNFTNGWRCDYAEWMKGKRVAVNGNKASWKQSAQLSNTHDDLWKYLEVIFSYCGSLSLSKELKPVDVNDMQPGDVFIIGGSPGHAEIVVDVAVSLKTKQKIFMLAQSYMPAQETQILLNPNDEKLSPWYSVDFENPLRTPEYEFQRNQLMRFQE